MLFPPSVLVILFIDCDKISFELTYKNTCATHTAMLKMVGLTYSCSKSCPRISSGAVGEDTGMMYHEGSLRVHQNSKVPMIEGS